MSAAEIMRDPMLALIREYRSQMATFNGTQDMSDEEADALAAATYQPALSALERGGVPVTTEKGAVEAMRLISEEMAHSEDTRLARPITAAVLAYLESGRSMSAAKKNGPEVLQHRPGLVSTCEQPKGAEMNKQQATTTADQNSSGILALADLAAHAEAVYLEADKRFTHAVTAKNHRADRFFTDQMNRAFDDRMAFLDAMTRVKAGSVKEAGAQLVAATFLYGMLDCEFPGSASENIELYKMLQAIGRVLFSVGEAIEAEHGAVAGGGFARMTESPWVAELDHEEEQKERAA
jgi:hypothetical protein